MAGGVYSDTFTIAFSAGRSRCCSATNLALHRRVLAASNDGVSTQAMSVRGNTAVA